jgi:nitroreductase
MIDTLTNHRSIRRYKSDPISDETLHSILEAGTRASNTGNMQIYSIVVTKDKAIREKLWEVHFKQNMVLQAPVILTFCADINRFNKWCSQRNAVAGFDNFQTFMAASIDAMLVAQNVAVAAETFGLGICYLGTTTYNAGEIIDILNLPMGVVPVTTLVLGYPDHQPGLTDRLPLEAVVHHEVYEDYSAKDIDRLYAEKESSELTRDLLKINNKETLAQIFTDNRYTKKDNVYFSKVFLSVLEDQGFMNNEE